MAFPLSATAVHTPQITADAPRPPARRSSASPGLRIASGVIAAGFAFPAAYVVWRTFSLRADLVSLASEVAAPLGRTLLLATLVAVAGAVVATAFAFLLDRTDLPGGTSLRLILALPIVLPSFVGATAFVAALAPGGFVYELLSFIGFTPPRRFRGLGPAWFVLTTVTYPYVLLPVLARLRSLPSSLEESARTLGDSSLVAFWRVTLPQLRPAILAGSLLAFLYSIGDFGAVQLLGYDTLTRVIFAAKLSQRSVAFAAAMVLLIVAWVASAGERKASRRGSVDEAARSRPATPVALGRRRWLVAGVAWSFVGLVLVVPIVSLVIWAVRSISAGDLDFGGLVAPILNTTFVGVLTAVLAVLVVLPLAILTVRHRSRFGSVLGIGVMAGFAVPGLVLALSLVFWALGSPVSSWLYQRLPLLVLAYVVHFGALALGAAEGAVRSVPDRLIEASRTLGTSVGERIRRVDYPLMRPGLASGAGLVLLSTVKELPATLLLAPTGFDTLATEVWSAIEDARFGEASTYALVLIAVSAVLTYVLVLRGGTRALAEVAPKR